MYEWAGSTIKLSRYLKENGVSVSAGTLNNRRIMHGVGIANPTYGKRFGEIEEVKDTEALEALQEYFENRKVPAPPPPSAAKVEGEYATCLVASDLHYPFHHEAAFEVFLGLADTIKPSEIVINGDCFDFAQLGHYTKDPTAHAFLQSDIDQCREKVLSRIQAPVKRFIVGNHEEGRWKNYIFNRAPELASLRCLTMEAVLGLTEMGWAWQPYEHWPTDALCIYHGDRHTSVLGGGSAMSARKESVDMGVSTITGHTHHAGAFFRQDRAGYRVSYEIGGLMDWRKMQAAHVTTRRTPVKVEDWHLACALVRYKSGHSAFRVELIPIIDDGKRTFCIYQDEELVA